MSGAAIHAASPGDRHAAPGGERLIALQSVPNWLPLTSTWLFAEVKHLPPDVESRVVCEDRKSVV